jgi:hypothetical protein
MIECTVNVEIKLQTELKLVGKKMTVDKMSLNQMTFSQSTIFLLKEERYHRPVLNVANTLTL